MNTLRPGFRTPVFGKGSSFAFAGVLGATDQAYPSNSGSPSAKLFENWVLPFDTAAALRYGDRAVKARAAGKGLPTPDGYIAAIASARGFTVASRDASPFKAAGYFLGEAFLRAVMEKAGEG